MSLLTEDEIVRGLVAKGVPREVAQREARSFVDREAMYPRPSIGRHKPILKWRGESVEIPPAGWPITLRIPWSALVSDNAMYVVDKKTGKRHKSAVYLESRKRIRALAADAMFGPLADCPLSLMGRFWVPNNHRRDVHNFGATLCDSLKGALYTDDHWLHRVTWERAGIDVDGPRCELTLSPLTPQEPTPP